MNSLKNQLLEYVRKQRKLIHSGQIERFAGTLGFKNSNGGRRMRELAESGKVEAVYKKNKMSGIKEVWYRV